MTDTWLSSENADLSGISGFKSFHTVREITRGGGISIFVSETFLCKEVGTFSLPDGTIECCAVRVEINTEFLIISDNSIGLITIPFISSSRMNNILGNPLFQNKKVYWLGGFNVNLLLSNVNNFMSTLQSFSIYP